MPSTRAILKSGCCDMRSAEAQEMCRHSFWPGGCQQHGTAQRSTAQQSNAQRSAPDVATCSITFSPTTEGEPNTQNTSAGWGGVE